ncbi:hypothetical protein RHMOL_Rhmol04G0077800 [Rhododendron molle]|uniref:Uncharacterized protein n=1 Tax=Rhododendron molle TaxID=49168 RepID=A0ACC0NZ87_RHOML|nr:hypothetical protein RHMOL_Rhmol04G0077800 [Rhododendron molle]
MGRPSKCGQLCDLEECLGLNLPTKFALFIWKVLHRILPVRQVLIRRGIGMNALCPVCGLEEESIEHLFFMCETARRFWRASNLGLDFSIGNPLPFNVWFNQWWKGAPNKSIVVESIITMWSIWCNRNNLAFGRTQDPLQQSLAEAYRTLRLVERAMSGYGLKDGIRGPWGAGAGCGKQRVVLKSNLGEVNDAIRLPVDGAWDKNSWEGAVAWCSVGADGAVRNEGRREVFASSVLLAEALVVWNALVWAFERGWLSVEICSDCLVLVQGFQRTSRVHPLVRIILSDVVHLACRFNYVVVSKVPRTEVRAAHAIAKDVNFQV